MLWYKDLVFPESRIVTRNVVFDWSGTLIDDFHIIYTASMEVFDRLGISRLSPRDFRQEFCLPYMRFYRKYDQYTMKKKIDDIYRNALDLRGRPKLHKGARAVLQGLRKRAVRMALFSSDRQEKIAGELDYLRLRHYFVAVQADVLDKTKAVEGFLNTCGFRAEETVLVGDMSHDIEAGKKAGMGTVAVTWGFEPEKKLEKSSPDYIIDSAGLLLDIIFD